MSRMQYQSEIPADFYRHCYDYLIALEEDNVDFIEKKSLLLHVLEDYGPRTFKEICEQHIVVFSKHKKYESICQLINALMLSAYEPMHKVYLWAFVLSDPLNRFLVPKYLAEKNSILLEYGLIPVKRSFERNEEYTRALSQPPAEGIAGREAFFTDRQHQVANEEQRSCFSVVSRISY